jgi:polyisoprenoid-binding protein YceI
VNRYDISEGFRMKIRFGVLTLLGPAVAIAMFAAGAVLAGAEAPVALDSARITISGTSNIHAYTATTTTARVTRAQFTCAFEGPDMWANALKPGAIDAFEITIPAATLTSPREGLDKNMHEALKVKDYPDIVFRLLRFEPGTGAAGALRAVGVLRVAGVERELPLNITVQHEGTTLKLQGRVAFLMTDFGIKPPVAMLGMLKTDPKVIITFDTAMTAPRS